ncbi:ABC transporter ATP-binding protein [Eubacterium sp.]|uniref:ABC transporter ATP-binding protein n=1 Tax=Eubacterium sp. TaxID=142586 RepID=UPI0035209109
MKEKKYNLFSCLWLPIKYCPVIALLIALFDICLGVIPTLQTLAVASFIDKSLKLAAKNTTYDTVLVSIILLIFLIAASWLIKSFKDLVVAKFELRLRETFRVNITKKKNRLKYYCIEDAKTWDLISRISDKPETRLKDAYINFLNFISLIIQIVGLILVFATQIWQISLIMLMLIIPVFVISLKSGKENYITRQETQKYHRRQEYLGDLLINRETAQERILFGYGRGLTKMWHSVYEKARKTELKTKRDWFIRSKLGGVMTTGISVIASLFLIPPVLTKTISTGMFISFINSIYALVDTIVWSLANYVEKIADNREFMKDFTLFFSLEEHDQSQEEKVENIQLETIEFRNVKFKYPNTDKYILNGFSYKFERGVSYALIGVNGAGKTTLMKLLVGLYDEYSGEILVNGKNVREYSVESYKRLFSIVFQDFAKYSLSIEENITIGDWKNKLNVSESDIEKIAKIVGLDKYIDEDVAGLKTKLGKIYEDGQDISGGQWQRIALARAIFRNGQLYILDEPTSALDPISESNLYKEFKNISVGKTMILVSHRLGSTSIADTILVLTDGKLAEVGSHQELMKKQGLYAEMYESQRSWYGE